VKPVQRHLLQVNFGGDDSDNDSDYEVKHSGMLIILNTITTKFTV